MTKKEAVEVLRSTAISFGRNQGKTAYMEALELAINELECADSENIVNMSMEHYDKLKETIRAHNRKNEILNDSNERLTKMLISIGIPPRCIPAIVPNSFSVRECEDISGPYDRFKRIQIAFDLDSKRILEVGG